MTGAVNNCVFENCGTAGGIDCAFIRAFFGFFGVIFEIPAVPLLVETDFRSIVPFIEVLEYC